MKSETQIELERKAWAKVIHAWLVVSKAVERPDLTADQLDEYDRAMRDAIAIAHDWGLNSEAIIDELTASETGTKAA